MFFKRLRDQGVLTFPSVQFLRNLTRQVGSTTDRNEEYLKRRVKELNNFERNVLLMLDEIYTAKRVEYAEAQGRFVGLTENDGVATTALCFMVRSLAGKYRDIISIVPMNKVSARKIRIPFEEALQLLDHVGLNVVAVSADNHSANRKFFTDLGQGNLQASVPNPVTGQPLFLVFDPVHNIKNLYNCFQRKKRFEFPPLTSRPLLTTADFTHLNDLYSHETTKPIKLAPRLTTRVLNPGSIDKTNVQLSMAIIHESTIGALRAYSDNDGKPWRSTAEFLQLLRDLWNVLNAHSPDAGRHKRDLTKDPVRSVEDWKLKFLSDFSSFFTLWETSGKPGLTKETFLSVRHTCSTLVLLAKHCLNSLGFNYVLLGNVQSDALEARFGWFRQLCGANYYISLKQILESERKIRTLSLVKMPGIDLKQVHCSLNVLCI